MKLFPQIALSLVLLGRTTSALSGYAFFCTNENFYYSEGKWWLTADCPNNAGQVQKHTPIYLGYCLANDRGNIVYSKG